MDDQARVARFYDQLGIGEWLRLDSDVRARVFSHVHSSILRRWVVPESLVLDAGCGPGRFSLQLMEGCTKVVAGDISAGQLDLAEQQVNNGCSLLQLTVTDLPFADQSFDATVCFGAVLSHAGHEAEVALRELVRVTRAGGQIILSVLPRHSFYLPGLMEQVRVHGLQAIDEAIRSDREVPDTSGIPWRGFGHDELVELALNAGCEVLEISASNVLARVEQIPLLEELEQDAALWRAFLGWEEHLGRQRSNTEAGAFIIAVLRKTTQDAQA